MEFLQNGESSVHYTATIEVGKSSNKSDDRQLMSLLLKNGGDVNLGTTEVSSISII